MADATPGGWHDPERPGVPLNRERTGPHWVEDKALGHVACVVWCHVMEQYHDMAQTMTPEAAAKFWRYLGPCLTPAEVAALQQRLDDMTADYLRRHHDACDRAEELRALRAEVAAREAAAWCAGRDAGVERVLTMQSPLRRANITAAIAALTPPADLSGPLMAQMARVAEAARREEREAIIAQLRTLAAGSDGVWAHGFYMAVADAERAIRARGEGGGR